MLRTWPRSAPAAPAAAAQAQVFVPLTRHWSASASASAATRNSRVRLYAPLYMQVKLTSATCCWAECRAQCTHVTHMAKTEIGATSSRRGATGPSGRGERHCERLHLGPSSSTSRMANGSARRAKARQGERLRLALAAAQMALPPPPPLI